MNNYQCPKCGSFNTEKQRIRYNKRHIRCRDCGRYTTVEIDPKRELHTIKSSNMGISKDEFRKKHDIQFRLSQIIEMFEDDIFYEKADLLKLAGMSPSQAGAGLVLESDTFKDHRGKAGGKWYYAKKELIEEMKKDGLMV